MSYVSVLLQLIQAVSPLLGSSSDIHGDADGIGFIMKRDKNDKKDESSKNSTTSNSASSSTHAKTTSSSASSISVNPNEPAGGISLTSPVATSTTYVKSGDIITFGWNYTNVINSPSALNIEVSCSQNHQVYTIAHNQSIKSSSVTWDTSKATADGGSHLISAEYTSSIYDASKSSSDMGGAGELSPFQFTFGLYLPQSYTAWAPGAKYVNVAIRLNSPEIITLAMGLIISTIASMM